MTESAEDRSKRKFCEYLNSYQWVKQISIFYDETDVAIQNALDDGLRLRKALARAFPDSVFLWRLALKNLKGRGVTPYWTAFTTGDFRTAGLSHYVSKFDGCSVKVRRIGESKISSYTRSVLRENPHNLKAVFGDRKINRFSLQNKSAKPLIEK
ncbi:MAG: hypothetical protein LRY66_02295 [Saccharospirillaceae bacterium]|nr:hypothetical protein [Saccharospirillaceae bacterium]